MADKPEKHSQTEEPTEHRLQTAVEKGNTPVSRDAAAFSALLGFLGAILIVSAASSRQLIGSIALIWEGADLVALGTASEVQALFVSSILPAAVFLAPALVVLLVAGTAGYVVQNRPRVVWTRVKPELSRISPAAGWKRMFGQHGLVEYLKSLLKLGIIATASAFYLASVAGEALNAQHLEPLDIPGMIARIIIALVVLAILVSAAFMAVDIFWARFHWMRGLKMTREEVKEEHKQLSGNPAIRARLRSIARDRARKRMMAAVPRATLVIANPTHFAVALRYQRSEGGAPVCLAKGKDLVALRIRALAESHGIPVIEDKPLARSLHDAVSVGQMIPPDFYRAVAKIILFLSSRTSPARRQ